jgi:hypothetical protein
MPGAPHSKRLWLLLNGSRAFVTAKLTATGLTQMKSGATKPMSKDELLCNRMRYYKPAVLAMFHHESDKYVIHTDEFEGDVRIRDAYHDPNAGTDDESHLNVSFGFRACRNGEWVVAAWMPDLDKASRRRAKALDW